MKTKENVSKVDYVCLQRLNTGNTPEENALKFCMVKTNKRLKDAINSQQYENIYSSFSKALFFLLSY